MWKGLCIQNILGTIDNATTSTNATLPKLQNTYLSLAGIENIQSNSIHLMYIIKVNQVNRFTRTTIA